MRARLRSVLVLPLLLAPLLFVGCDEAGGGTTFPVTIDGVQYTFEFTADGTVTATATQNISSDLPQGFGLGDVVSARIVAGSAQVLLVFPVSGVEIDILQDVTLSLTSGSTSTVVASQDDFSSMTGTMSGEADLDVRSVDVTSIVSAGDFGAQLVIDADEGALTPGTTYRLEVRFDLAVEVSE